MAALAATSLAIVTESVDSANQLKTIARWTAITAEGAVAGPIAAGWFTETLSCRWFLGSEALIAIALAALLRFFVTESPDRETQRSLDLAGTAALGIGPGATIYGLTIVPDVEVTTARVIPALAVGGDKLSSLLQAAAPTSSAAARPKRAIAE